MLQTHTHSQFILIHCLWLTPERQTSQPVAFPRPVCTTPLLLLLHSSILLHDHEGSPVILPCLHKIPLASLQITLHQDQRWCSFMPHVQVLPLITVPSYHQHLHDSCDIHDHNEGSAVFVDMRFSYASGTSNGYGTWFMSPFWHK